MLHELRIYHCMPGRLHDLSRRFETITLRMWAKHGIHPVAFWTVTIGESNNDFYYLLAWESLADREKKWNAFTGDPEWIKARTDTEANGPIVASLSNCILTPTPYSPLK